MGCGVTLTSETVGAAPVTAPVESTGNTTWAMNTFQAWPDWLLGSTLLFEPYQTASARPGPPALIHGNTLTASPVPVDPSLTWVGGVRRIEEVQIARRVGRPDVELEVIGPVPVGEPGRLEHLPGLLIDGRI